MRAEENKSRAGYVCPALSTENPARCVLCEALAHLLGSLENGDGERERALLSVAPVSTSAHRTDLSDIPPGLPPHRRGGSLPSQAHQTAPATALSPWSRIPLPMCEKPSPISWVQTYARQSSTSCCRGPLAPLPPTSQLTDQPGTTRFPLLPLFSLAFRPMSSRSVAAPSLLSGHFPNCHRLSKSVKTRAVPPTPTAQEVLLPSTLPHTAEHDLLWLWTPPPPSRSSRSSSLKIRAQADQPAGGARPFFQVLCSFLRW